MVESYFQNIKEVIVDELTKAKTSVDLASAFFTDKSLFDVLCALARNGVKVRLVVSDELTNIHNKGIDFSELINSGGEFFLSSRTSNNSLMHHKFCIIDGAAVITGSYNYTNKAQENRENIVVVKVPDEVKKFQAEFEYVLDEFSVPMREWKDKYIFSGFEDIDRITGGFYSGELICLAGKPAMGTTSFAISLAHNMSSKFDYKVGYILTDISGKNLGLRFMCLRENLPLSNLKKGVLHEWEWQKLHLRASEVSQLPIEIYEAQTIDDIETRCKAFKYQNVDFIIIDKIDSLLKKDFINEFNDHSYVLDKLKALVRQVRIPILFTTSALEKSKRRGGFSFRSDISDLGKIADFPHTVMLLNRYEFYGMYEDENGESTVGKAEVSIPKHYHGSTGYAMLNYNPISLEFSNINLEVPPVESSDIKPENFIIRPNRMSDLEEEPPF